MRAWTVLRIVTLLALVVNVASAHHPFSAHYDLTKSGTLTGTVAAVQWTNPHVVLALDVVGDDGTTQHWMIEGYPPNTLLRSGWAKDSLRKGDRISITGWHARDASLMIFSGHEITFQDGSTRIFGSDASNPGPYQWKCATDDCPAAKWIPSITE